MSGPVGAGAGPTPKTYRPPTEEELEELRLLMNMGWFEPVEITSKDAHAVLAWLKKHPDVSVNSSFDDGEGEDTTSILLQVFNSQYVPVNHPIIDEIACRNPDFGTSDDPQSVISRMELTMGFWTRFNVHGTESAHASFRAKYELAKNPAAIKERCNRKFMRQGVKDVANLQKSSKAGLPLPEGPMSIVTGLLTGKPGDTATQMATAKKELGKGGRRKTRRRKTRRTRRR